MSVDSIPVFEERVRSLGLEEHLGRFRELGWTTLGNLAFSSDYVPGQSEGSVFTKDLVVPALKEEEHPDRFKLRRLFVEAFSLAASDLRRRCEFAEGDEPRRLPVLEREARRNRVASRLTGLNLVGELEPSFRLQDLAFEIFDSNGVRYVPWESCTSRDVELAEGAKTDRAWKADSSGFLKQTAVSDASKADTRSDYKLLCALRRRAVAFEMSDVASFDSLEVLTNVLLAELHRVPPPGYAKVSLDQLARADKEVFKLLAERCRSGVRRGPDGLRPLDVHLPSVVDSPQVRYLLMPLPASGRSMPDSEAASQGNKRSLEQAIRDLKAENKRLRASHVPSPPGGGGGGHKGGGGKGSGKKGPGRGTGKPRVPAALIGKSFQTPAGEPICFAFNLPSGCSTQVPAGGSCPRGMHVCAEPGCNRHHSLTEHS